MMISAFDLDYTLLNHNSSYLFGRFLCNQKHFSVKSSLFITWCQISFLLGITSLEKLHQNAFYHLFYGIQDDLIEKYVQEFLHLYLEKLLYQPAIQKLKQAQDAGHITVILSSSPEFLVAPIAKHLGVSIWKSTEYCVDMNGCYSNIKTIMLGENKARILENLQHHYGILRKDVIAYSDSHHDLAFLSSAGSAFGVNPNRKLRSICRQNNWPMI